jgi:hypothetical protein
MALNRVSRFLSKPLFPCQRSCRRDYPTKHAAPRARLREEPAHGGGDERNGPGRRGSDRTTIQGYPRFEVQVILRKEVIQPQVLLRLPCYDLVPIIELTFGAFRPCGLDQRLRVLPTLVA